MHGCCCCCYVVGVVPRVEVEAKTDDVDGGFVVRMSRRWRRGRGWMVAAVVVGSEKMDKRLWIEKRVVEEARRIGRIAGRRGESVGRGGMDAGEGGGSG